MIKSKRGGGPKTSEGKLTASKNAIKTGAYSGMVVLPGESEEKFQALLDQFIQDFSPQDIAETSIITELAVLTWKRLRLEKIGHSEMIRALSQPVSHYDLSFVGVHLQEDDSLLLKDLRLLTPEYIQSYRNILKFINAFQSQSSISPADISKIPERCPDFVERAFDLSEEYWQYDRANTAWAKLAVFECEEHGKKEPFVYVALKSLKTRAMQAISFTGMQAKIQNGIKEVHERRIINLMVSEKNNRASEDLSRAFFKTLGELRRQQKWRKDIRTIDVSDADADAE
jgi:hypothetical protein